MNDQPIYVPVLKGKEGEFAALEVLAPSLRPYIFPLIEVPDIPYDYVSERSSRSLDEHIAGIGERLAKSCRDMSPYIDLPWFTGTEHLSDGRIALDAILSDCRSRGLSPVPVVSRKSSDEYVKVASRYLSQNNAVVCIRLLVSDFDETVELDSEVGQLRTRLNAGRRDQADLILDLGDLSEDASKAVLIARSIFSLIPEKDEWRRIVLAGASFPEDLSEVSAATITTRPRHEWTLWRALRRKPTGVPRNLVYGDYAISHPSPTELDPRTMRMSANIRYTCPEEWLIVKGRNVRQHGFEQYFDLAKTLSDRKEYCGPDYSWGDKYIFDCGQGIVGPGNATTWRKVGTNHHITLIVRQLAKVALAA